MIKKTLSDPKKKSLMQNDEAVTPEKKPAVSKAKKIGVSVAQLAADIGVTVERLMSQFKDARMGITKITDLVSEDEKQELLRYLQKHHGAKDGAQEIIILRRAKTSELKVSGTQGAGKTISVQVRKKRTYVKRSLIEEEQQP